MKTEEIVSWYFLDICSFMFSQNSKYFSRVRQNSRSSSVKFAKDHNTSHCHSFKVMLVKLEWMFTSIKVAVLLYYYHSPCGFTHLHPANLSFWVSV